MKRLVVDTNVLVSGLLSAHGPPGRVVDAIAVGDVVVLHDDRILDEYRSVLARPRFGFAPGAVAAFLDALVNGGVPVYGAPLASPLPDEADRKFLEVAAAGGADALVTGNLRHFPASARRAVLVITPREWLARSAR